MVLWYETHATSLDNEAGLASGWFDVALSPLGERQARELGERRRDTGLSAVYASDLRRAHDTAAIAFANTDVPIFTDPRLRECDYGELTRRAAADLEPQRLDHIASPFPGGESYVQATARLAEWLRETAATYGDKQLLVIGHRATFYALEHLCRGRALEEVMRAPWVWQPGWRYEVPAIG